MGDEVQRRYEEETRALEQLSTDHLERSIKVGMRRAMRWFLVSAGLPFVLVMGTVIWSGDLSQEGLTLGLKSGLLFGAIVGAIVTSIAVAYQAAHSGVSAVRDLSAVRERRQILNKTEVAGAIQLASETHKGDLELTSTGGDLSIVPPRLEDQD